MHWSKLVKKKKKRNQALKSYYMFECFKASHGAPHESPEWSESRQRRNMSFVLSFNQ